MKKIVLSLFAVAIAALSATAQGTSPSATKQIYDFTGFGDKQLLDLFYNALQQGRNYPTVAEFEAAGIQASDIAFVRSHVRPRSILDRSDRLVEKTYEKRELWMNIPMNIGSGNDAGKTSCHRSGTEERGPDVEVAIALVERRVHLDPVVTGIVGVGLAAADAGRKYPEGKTGNRGFPGHDQ